MNAGNYKKNSHIYLYTKLYVSFVSDNYLKHANARNLIKKKPLLNTIKEKMYIYKMYCIASRFQKFLKYEMNHE